MGNLLCMMLLGCWNSGSTLMNSLQAGLHTVNYSAVDVLVTDHTSY